MKTFDRKKAKREARLALSQAHPHVMLVTLVYQLLATVVPVVVLLVVLLQMGMVETWSWMELLMFCILLLVVSFYSVVAQTGYLSYVMRLARGEEAGFWCLLEGFAQTGRVLKVAFLQFLRMLPWTLLASCFLTLMSVVQGLVGGVVGDVFFVLSVGVYTAFLLWLTLRYTLVYFLMLDHPEQGANWAISESIQMMRGEKWRCLVLLLSFLGWELLSGCTMGILGLWVVPYQSVTLVHFYEAAADLEYTDHMPLTF